MLSILSGSNFIFAENLAQELAAFAKSTQTTDTALIPP